MRDVEARTQTFVFAAVAIAVVALVAWSTWIISQPACGPPGTTKLAHLDRWAPAIFIAAEFAATSIAGYMLKRTLVLIAVTLTTVGGIAILTGALLDFLIAAHQGCFS